jgi:hypothetical protein
MAKRRRGCHDRTPKPLSKLPGPADLARFLSFVKLGTIPKKHRTPCWTWTGHRNKKGYGQFYYMGKAEGAHRFSYQGFKQRKLKKGHDVHHTCLNSSCVNPSHVGPLPSKDNGREGAYRRWGKQPLPVPKPEDDIPF